MSDDIERLKVVAQDTDRACRDHHVAATRVANATGRPWSATDWRRAEELQEARARAFEALQRAYDHRALEKQALDVAAALAGDRGAA